MGDAGGVRAIPGCTVKSLRGYGEDTGDIPGAPLGG